VWFSVRNSEYLGHAGLIDGWLVTKRFEWRKSADRGNALGRAWIGLKEMLWKWSGTKAQGSFQQVKFRVQGDVFRHKCLLHVKIKHRSIAASRQHQLEQKAQEVQTI
jgi:hypothetical protein